MRCMFLRITIYDNLLCIMYCMMMYCTQLLLSALIIKWWCNTKMHIPLVYSSGSRSNMSHYWTSLLQRRQKRIPVTFCHQRKRAVTKGCNCTRLCRNRRRSAERRCLLLPSAVDMGSGGSRLQGPQEPSYPPRNQSINQWLFIMA